jgi:prepilin-type processing-associated H-X9-DG protein
MVLINRYSNAKDLFRCPSALKNSPYGFPIQRPCEITKRFTAASYGINEYVLFTQWGNWYKESSIPHPAKTLLVADCCWVLIMDWTTITGPDGVNLPQGMVRAKYANTPWSAFAPPNSWTGDIKQFQPRHSHMVQIAFMDGHVKAVQYKEFAYEGPASIPDPKNLNVRIREYPVIHPLAEPYR